MTERDGSLAFKCTFHDGGREGFIGYKGTCSDANIIRNIRKKKKTWCSQEQNPCNQFLDNECSGRRPEYPCYESRLLLDWKFGGGFYHTGDKEGQPVPLHGARPGKIALLTTRLPEQDHEQDRIVFAVSKIDRISESEVGGRRYRHYWREEVVAPCSGTCGPTPSVLALQGRGRQVAHRAFPLPFG